MTLVQLFPCERAWAGCGASVAGANGSSEDPAKAWHQRNFTGGEAVKETLNMF